MTPLTRVTNPYSRFDYFGKDHIGDAYSTPPIPCTNFLNFITNTRTILDSSSPFNKCYNDNSGARD